MMTLDHLVNLAATIKKLQVPELPLVAKNGPASEIHTVTLCRGFQINIFSSPSIPKDTALMLSGPLKKLGEGVWEVQKTTRTRGV